MDNTAQTSNPNIKNVSSPVSAQELPASAPKMIPPKPPIPPATAQSEQEMEDLSPIEKIRRDAQNQKKGGTNKTKAGTKTESTQSPAKEKDQIRIVIRDAKPPMAARILQGFMRVICLILIVAVCGIGIPRLFGINEFNVLTGSMTPTYPIGTLVFVQPKDPSTIRPGEVVTVIMNENLDMITHRVTANNYDDKTIVTKGDANNSEDGPSLYENVVGVVCFSIPYVGGMVEYVTNDTQGRIVGIGIVLAILALTFIAEGICFLLTKQAANVYQPNGKHDYNVRNIKARQFNRKFKRAGARSRRHPGPPNS